jgi:uncharacterized protein (DUF1501 family)
MSLRDSRRRHSTPASSPASNDLSRRKFIGACCAAVGTTGMLSALAQLRMIGALASTGGSSVSAATGPDFKALVCLFLAGGNDANNLIIPYDTADYAAYATGRGALALPQAPLLPIAPRTSDGRSWALHPAMPELQSLFGQGKFALLGNVGTLVVPVTQAQYNGRTVPLPPQLFSHNDQSVQWQSSVPDKPFQTGWGGRLADLTNALNGNNQISMSISLAGQNAFQVGRYVSQYAVGTSGAIRLSGSATGTTTASGIRTTAQNELLAQQDPNLFAAAFGGITSDAISDSALLSGVIAATAPFTTTFPTSSLGQQLRMIARLIGARDQLGLKRQVFFARVSGWDLHDNQVDATDTTTGAHANLLRDLSLSLKAFYDATVEMGVPDRVTTFTASDFGRTYNTNGRGSDHGWGSHHLILGGAVKGGDVYGRIPNLTIGGPDDTGRGRWIPTTSVDEYNATLAQWFGVSPSNISTVLPNIGRFHTTDLGFMNAG